MSGDAAPGIHPRHRSRGASSSVDDRTACSRQRACASSDCRRRRADPRCSPPASRRVRPRDGASIGHPRGRGGAQRRANSPRRTRQAEDAGERALIDLRHRRRAPPAAGGPRVGNLRRRARALPARARALTPKVVVRQMVRVVRPGGRVDARRRRSRGNLRPASRTGRVAGDLGPPIAAATIAPRQRPPTSAAGCPSSLAARPGPTPRTTRP